MKPPENVLFVCKLNPVTEVTMHNYHYVYKSIFNTGCFRQSFIWQVSGLLKIKHLSGDGDTTGR